MTTALRISDTLALDVDAFLTSTQAILAKKGSGKSYTASVQAEELLSARQQVLVVDPTGAWHGLRSSADGTSPGYSIAVLGGEHADVPLEPLAGEVIADAIAADHFSAILDLSLFRKGEALRFMVSFLETLYRKNRDALHLFVDEADVVAPQKPFGPDEAKVLGAMEDIVRRGRIRGIGCTLITQRPQVLNKNVLSQVDMLTALRMNHPKDLAAVAEWVAVHADVAAAKRMMTSLPSLPIGDAWLWAPAQDLFERATIRRRRTFDSGRTPKAGERTVGPKVLAQVDIQRLGATIAATVERVKQDDPKVLRARVAELERQLKASVEIETVERVVEVEVPILKDQQLATLQAAVSDARGAMYAAEKAAEQLGIVIKDIEATIHLAGQLQPKPSDNPAIAAVKQGMRAVAVPPPPPRNAAKAWPGPPPTASALVPAQQKILDTIATLGVLRIDSTRTTLAAWLGQHPNTKGLVNNLGALRSAGLVAEYSLTADGAKVARPNKPRTTLEVREILLRPLSPAQRRIVDVVLKHGSVTREDLAAELGQHPNTKGLVNNIGALRGRALLSQGWPLRPERVFQAGAR